MDAQELRNFHEAYMEVYNELDEGVAGDVADRAAKLERQRKGQTPERQEMYRKLKNKAQEREEDPKTIERHKSFGRKGGGTFGAGGQFRTELTQSRRDERRKHQATKWRSPYDPKYKKHTEGPGTITKNPKKLRKQKAMGEIGENYDLYDIILSHLLDEGYAETPEAAERIMVNMSEEWRESICEAEIEPPKERVGALTNIDIPQNERDAARKRTREKAKRMREKKKN
jgi:hypothetical protein